MINLKTNVNGKTRIFSSNIKKDRIMNHYNKSRKVQDDLNGGPSRIKIVEEYSRKENDSLMSLNNDEITYKPIVA